MTDKDEFMTDIKLGSTNPNNKHFFFGEKEGYKPILHPRMRGMMLMLSEPNLILWVKKEAGQIRHISDIQVSHHKEDEMNLQRRNYEMLPLCLSKFGCGYGSKIWLLWTASSNIMRLTDCEHIQKEVTEYTEMLSKSPDDPILRKMVDTSQFRLKQAQLREEERARDIPGDDLVYTKDFLALQSHELKKMRTVFKRSIDLDNDGKVSVEDFATFLREPYMCAFLREIFALALSSGNVNTHSDSSKSPIFSLGSTLKTVAVFCMLSSVEVTKFIFSCFDKKGCGWIDRAAFLGSLEMLHSKHRDDRIISALKEINLPEGGSLKFAQFEGKNTCKILLLRFTQLIHFYSTVDLSRRFPHLLYPAFRVQDKIRQQFMGTKWWKRKLQIYLVAAQRVVEEKKRENELERMERKQRYEMAEALQQEDRDFFDVKKKKNRGKKNRNYSTRLR